MLKKNELRNKVVESFNYQDPFRLEDQLTEEEIQIRNLAKSFAQKELLPNIVLQNRNESYDSGCTCPCHYGSGKGKLGA